MIDAICKDCGELFAAIVILGITDCPKCGSQNTAAAVSKDAEQLTGE